MLSIVESDFFWMPSEATGLPSGPMPKYFEMKAGWVFLLSSNV